MDLGLEQREAARKTGVKLGSYVVWERDRAVPTAPWMGRLVGFLGYDPTPLPDDFPGRLTALRRRAGLTQAKFSRKVGVDPSTASSWEQGITIPPPPLWPRIIRALGADPSPEPLTLADRLLALRRRLGLSQAEMADRLEVRASSISFWELGGRPLRATEERLETAIRAEAPADSERPTRGTRNVRETVESGKVGLVR